MFSACYDTGCWEKRGVHAAPLKGGNWKLASDPSWVPHAPFAFANVNLYPFAVINPNHEYNGFAKFCEAFWQITEPGWGHLNSTLPTEGRITTHEFS